MHVYLPVESCTGLPGKRRTFYVALRLDSFASESFSSQSKRAKDVLGEGVVRWDEDIYTCVDLSFYYVLQSPNTRSLQGPVANVNRHFEYESMPFISSRIASFLNRPTRCLVF